MNQEETMNLPIRYVSITTVPKEYTPHPVLPENQEVDMGTLLSAISSAKSQVSALSPYLFVLFETEKGGAFWQYLDMAGELSRIHFTSSGSYVNATKITFPNGAYMYRINQVFLGLLHGWFPIWLAASSVHHGRKLLARRFPGYASLRSK